MNKKQYISPSSVVVYTKVQAYLHTVSDTTNNLAMPDVTNDDVGLTGKLGFDNNEEGSDVEFAKGRSDNGPWESIW